MENPPRVLTCEVNSPLEKETIEEKKVRSLIELRGYKLLEKEKHEGMTRYIVEVLKGKKAAVFAVHKKIVGVASIKKLYKFMEEKGVEKGIIVAEKKYSAAIKKEAKSQNIELIPGRLPPSNIFLHELVPEHTILSAEEVEELLREYKINLSQLPQIKVTDVAVIAIGGRAGDVIKIARESPTAGEHIVYRLVVP